VYLDEILAYTLDGLRSDCALVLMFPKIIPYILRVCPTSKQAFWHCQGSFQRHLTTHHSRAVTPSATPGSLSLTRIVIIGSVTVREPGNLLGVIGCYKLRLSELSTSTSITTSVMSHDTSSSLLSSSYTAIVSDYSTFTTTVLHSSNTAESSTTIVSPAVITITSESVIVTT
jgi:hypothetical protein